jgi:hypothetical protein
MATLKSIFEVLRAHSSLQVLVALLTILAYPLTKFTCNLYFHPLAKFPGPKLWAISRVPFAYSLLSGGLVKRSRELHERYGPVFRMAPDELSFASEEAWNDIYAWRKGHKRSYRDPAFYVAPEGQADNIITTSDVKYHARVRGLLSNSFTDDSLHAQASLIESHADMFIEQFYTAATSPTNYGKGALLNITDWFNFFTMDVVSEPGTQLKTPGETNECTKDWRSCFRRILRMSCQRRIS